MNMSLTTTSLRVTASNDPARIRSLYFCTTNKERDEEPKHAWKSRGWHARDTLEEDYFRTIAFMKSANLEKTSSGITPWEPYDVIYKNSQASSTSRSFDSYIKK